jgi:arginine decarboxylase
MPGENAGAADGPLLRYLSALEAFDKRFPGFQHDIHGVARDTNGNYAIECLTPEVALTPSNGSHPVTRKQPTAVPAGAPLLTT